MNLLITKDYEAMSKVAAIEFMECIAKSIDRRVNLSITAGKTPVRMYEILKSFYKDLEFPNVHYYNFDEIPVKNHEPLTMEALQEAFYTPNHIPKEQIEIFDMNNYVNYDEKIKDDGGIDMIMIGLGLDGHFCGNLSSTMLSFDEGCRAVNCNINKTIEERVAFLSGGKEHMCESYITFGPKTVMSIKKIVMIVHGVEKAEILKKALEGPICLDIPASILRLHPNFTVIVDEDAAKYLSK